jgi:HEAT repeat protein
MIPPSDVEARLRREIAAGRMSRSDAEELHQRLDLLAFNMIVAGQMGEVAQEAAAAWLFHLRTRKLFVFPHASAEEQEQANRWWALAETAGFLERTAKGMRFADASLQRSCCVHFCRSRPLDALLLRLTVRPSFREVWRRWARQDQHLLEQVLTLLSHSPQRQARYRAATVLGYLGDSHAMEALFAALHDASGGVRVKAAEALGAIGEAQAIGPLIACMQRDNPTVGSTIADILIQFGEPVVPPVLRLLEQPQNNIQRLAVYILGQLKDQRAIPPLLKLLSHPDPVLAYRAARALSGFGEPVIAPLLQALSSHDRRLRERAAYALGHTGAAQAAGPLLKLLSKRWEHPYVQQASYDALVRLGNIEAQPLLLTALQDKKKLVRAGAAEALGALGDRRAVPSLLIALQDTDPNVRSKAAGALEKLRDQQAVEALIGTLTDQEWSVRKFAAEALGKLGDQRAVEPLLGALREPNRLARAQMLRALGELGDTRAVEPLLSILSEPDTQESSGVKSWTTWALGKLGDMKANGSDRLPQ